MLLTEAQVQEMEADRRAGLNIRKTAQDGLIADWRAMRRVVHAAQLHNCDHDSGLLDDALAALDRKETP